MRTEIKMAIVGLVVLIASFLFTIFLYGLWMGTSGQEGHFQQLITQELIKDEIARFNENFYSSLPLTGKKNDAHGAFDHCKADDKYRILYSIDSKTFEKTSNGQYDVERFCTSLEKHMQCVQKVVNVVCANSQNCEPSVSVPLPADSLCSSQVVARLGYTFTRALQVGIVVDVFALALLLAFWLCSRSSKTLSGKATEAHTNGNFEGVASANKV